MFGEIKILTMPSFTIGFQRSFYCFRLGILFTEDLKVMNTKLNKIGDALYHPYKTIIGIVCLRINKVR